MKAKDTSLSEIPNLLKERGIRMDHFLNNIGVSRVHFFLVKKGKRPLTDERRKLIENFLKVKVAQ